MPKSPSPLMVGHFQVEGSMRFEDNLRAFKKSLLRAAEARLDLVSFPECFLNGYFGDEKRARAGAFKADSAKMRRVLEATRAFKGMVIVGFNEDRNGDLYNSALVARRGRLLGIYSKCMAYMPFHKRGREFPVFEHKGWKIGILICADGGYIEPARILALKGAQLIVAPHYNYIREENVFLHYQKVRADHQARAVENDLWFIRANNVGFGRDPKYKHSGIAYGDSYVINPLGQIVAQSALQKEDLLVARLDPQLYPQIARRSVASFAELGDLWQKTFDATVLSQEEMLNIRNPKATLPSRKR